MCNQENIDLDNNMPADSTDGNITSEMDENSDWLHSQSTFSNSLELLSDVSAPLSNIGDVDGVDTNEAISTVHEIGSGYAPCPINQLVTCPKERRRARDRARKATMSPGHRAQRNKRWRELNAIKKSAKMLEMTPEETSHNRVHVDTYDNLTKMDNNDAHEMGVVNTSGSFNNTATCPKERKRELERARRAAMSPEQKALLNKRRRDLYAGREDVVRGPATRRERVTARGIAGGPTPAMAAGERRTAPEREGRGRGAAGSSGVAMAVGQSSSATRVATAARHRRAGVHGGRPRTRARRRRQPSPRGHHGRGGRARSVRAEEARERKQFPIRLSFAMTVNKSHGQTIPNVGVYLPAPVFSHDQLYVAMSRATSRANIKILALSPDADAQEEAKKKEEKNARKITDGKKIKIATIMALVK